MTFMPSKSIAQKYQSIILFLSLTSLILCFNCNAEITITDYLSEISIQEDSSLIVKEHLSLISDSDFNISKLERNIPIRYLDNNNFPITIELQVLETKINEIQYEIKNNDFGDYAKVEIITDNSFLPRGKYEFIIIYKTYGNIGFFKDNDVLFFKSTGLNIQSKIKSNSTIISFPSKTKLENVQISASALNTSDLKMLDYKIISNFKDKSSAIDLGDHLDINNGFSLTATFPKGFVRPPSTAELLSKFKDSHRTLTTLIFLSFCLIILCAIIYSIRTFNLKQK